MYMYSDEQYENLEQEENSLTMETILVMFTILLNYKSDIKKELRNFYQEYGKDGVVTYQEARKWVSQQNHKRRLTVLQMYLLTKFTDMLGELSVEFNNIPISVIKKESDFFDIDLDISTLSFKWGLDNKDWLDRLTDDVELWKLRLQNDIKQSILKRSTLDDVLNLIDKRFESMKSVLESLGITESSAIGSLGRHAIFKELGISKYEFYTRADERTCETCGSMHGLEFPISAYEPGVTASPMHPRCRCWEVPIMD